MFKVSVLKLGSYFLSLKILLLNTFIFSLISTTLSVYRDESSIADYVTGGIITGAIYKANLGPAAMLVGAGLGMY